MDFSQLTPESFHLLCGRLLREEGFAIVLGGSRIKGIQVDYVVTPPGSDRQSVVEWSHRVPGGDRTDVREKIRKVISKRDLLGVPGAMLIFAAPLTLPAGDELAPHDIRVWDANDLQQLLVRHPQVAAEFTRVIDQSQRISRRVHNPTAEDIQIADLIRRLASHPPGQNDWRQYEDLCIEILNFLFIPPLGVPKIQSRSEDGLDRRDAIYPIGSGGRFWDLVRSDYRTRLVVAEFKNYTDPLGQKEVESVTQYLYDRAFRMFGLLCCRKEPGESAIKQWRKAWSADGKMVLFLPDRDLIEMLQRKADGEDPTEVMDLQLNDFLAELAP